MRSSRTRAIGVAAFLGGAVLLVSAACGGGATSVRNPYPADPESIARGAEIYTQHCESCHGIEGRGNGPEADGLVPPPANLLAHVPHHQEVVLFDTITKGVAGTSMEPWADDLTEGERWDAVNYLVSAFGGAAPQAGGGLSPLAVPTSEAGASGNRPIQQMSEAQFYATNCSGCHGAQRQGVVGPALTPSRLIAADEVYIDAIANGRPGTAMPGWKSLAGLSDDEIRVLVRWLKTDEAD